MKDYFAYNGENVIPTYMPGVPSYGQEGSRGNTGDRGSSVYYTSYTFPEDIVKCNTKIQEKKSLSNNIDEDNYNEYMEGDLVIDSLGNIYKIKLIDGELAISYDMDVHDSTNIGGEIFKNFRCKVITSLSSTGQRSSHKEIDRDYNLLAQYSSPMLYHSEVFKHTVYGNWISFSIKKIVESDDIFSYKFSLILPNGEVLSTLTYNNEAEIFIENRYLYGCFGCADFFIDSDDLVNFLGPDIAYRIKNNSVDNLIDYRFFLMNNESSVYASVLISCYIYKYCTAFVEIYNSNTGKVYRYDLNEFSLSVDGEDQDENNYNYVEPYTSMISWDYIKEKDYNNSIPVPKVEETENEITYYRTFKNYVVFPSIDIEEIKRSKKSDETVNDSENTEEPKETRIELTSASYTFLQNFFFIDKRGLSLPAPFTSKEDYIQDIWNNYAFDGNVTSSGEGTPLGIWLAQDLDERSSVLKVSFRNIEKFSLNILFNSYVGVDPSTSKLTEYMPYTMIYIGYPNTHLWQQGDENGNVTLPNSISEKYSTDDEPVYDGSTGVYYIYKIIPYGLLLNDGTNTASVADAGYSIISIDLTKFNLDLTALNWIEIGAMMFGKNANREHRPSIIYKDIQGSESSDDPNNIIYNITDENIDYRDMAFNTSTESGGRQALTNYAWPGACYSFTEIVPSSLANLREGYYGDVNDVYKQFVEQSNIEMDAGLSDITLFINNVEEPEEKESKESFIENITVEEEENYIDYAAHGILWDSSTYTVQKND